jgi:hypothetical protein
MAEYISTTLMDIHAHEEMRRRGIRTRGLGMESFELDKQGVFTLFTPASRVTATPEYVDSLGPPDRVINVLLYVRYWYAFKEDPEMPPEPWAIADKWFEHLPTTKQDGKRCIEIIDRSGFSTASGRRAMSREILRVLGVGGRFVLYEGTPWASTHRELL